MMTASEQRKDSDAFGQAGDEIERRVQQKTKLDDRSTPSLAAGPHAKPEQVNEAATPGAGTLPGPTQDEIEATSG
jgi:hypothetical protein